MVPPAPAKTPAKTAKKPRTPGKITRGGPATPTPPPAAPENERDYLVIFEESDPDGLPSDDTLVLDIESPRQTRGEMDVQQKLDIGLTNTTSRLGTAGFIVAIAGAVLSAILMVWFAVAYPSQWYDNRGTVNTSLVRSMALLAVIAILLLVVGTIMTHYGRRIKARGELKDVRIVEKEASSQMSFE